MTPAPTGSGGSTMPIEIPRGQRPGGIFFGAAMNKMLTLVGIGAFGAMGSMARFGVGELWGLATKYPAGTLTVNLLGAFALGWVNAVFKATDGPAAMWR